MSYKRFQLNEKYVYPHREEREIVKKLKSIYIDTEKGLVVINGEPVERVSHLCIEADGRKWSLAISKTEKYEAPKIDN